MMKSDMVVSCVDMNNAIIQTFDLTSVLAKLK